MKTHVPAHAITNRTAHMQCVWKLEDERLKLDNVRWHKDNKVFYSYYPNKHPNDQLLSVPGVNANVSKMQNCNSNGASLIICILFQDVEVTKTIDDNSGEILLRLKQVNPLSSGIYGCEVQTRDSVNVYGLPALKEMIVRDPSDPNHGISKKSVATLVVGAIVSLFFAARAIEN